ncbi:hypothetical protein QBC46DRAFT_453446 [Diplogelasinospora grovesii]|uniref:Uncharacterized protein n=1 Tax=Diplogelasinospora grovesii TaxID=303347 RepID=A0AAN6MYV5_9PEZI|nr:hypothetical protein QBC46DRAFT_453446 [Diplogelasinospora grovesii]
MTTPSTHSACAFLQRDPSPIPPTGVVHLLKEEELVSLVNRTSGLPFDISPVRAVHGRRRRLQKPGCPPLLQEERDVPSHLPFTGIPPGHRRRTRKRKADSPPTLPLMSTPPPSYTASSSRRQSGASPSKKRKVPDRSVRDQDAGADDPFVQLDPDQTPRHAFLSDSTPQLAPPSASLTPTQTSRYSMRPSTTGAAEAAAPCIRRDTGRAVHTVHHVLHAGDAAVPSAPRGGKAAAAGREADRWRAPSGWEICADGTQFKLHDPNARSLITDMASVDELTMSEFLHRMMFRQFNAPEDDTRRLKFNKGCRLTDVELTAGGIATRGHLWKLGSIIDTARFPRELPWIYEPRGRLTLPERKPLLQLVFGLRELDYRWLADRIDEYLTADADAEEEYRSFTEMYLHCMAAELAAAILDRRKLRLGSIWDKSERPALYRALCVWSDRGGDGPYPPAAFAFTSAWQGDSGSQTHDANDIDRHVYDATEDSSTPTVMLEEARNKLRINLLMNVLEGDWQCGVSSKRDRHRPDCLTTLVRRISNLDTMSISDALDALNSDDPPGLIDQFGLSRLPFSEPSMANLKRSTRMRAGCACGAFGREKTMERTNRAENDGEKRRMADMGERECPRTEEVP